MFRDLDFYNLLEIYLTNIKINYWMNYYSIRKEGRNIKRIKTSKYSIEPRTRKYVNGFRFFIIY